MSASIFAEIIEVFIHQILYLRDVYPRQIFKKFQMYNTAVYIISFPPLNKYIQNVLKSIQELNKDLKFLEILLYVNENKIMERHLFDVSRQSEMENNTDNKFMLDFEEHITNSLYTMSEHMKQLPTLPNETKMKILLHTTQNGHIRLKANVDLQKFRWREKRKKLGTSELMEHSSFLPLASVPHLGINIMTEIYK